MRRKKRSYEQKSASCNIDDYFSMISGAKYKKNYGEGNKMS